MHNIESALWSISHIFVGKRDLRLYPYNPLIHFHTYRIAGRELKALSLEAKFIFFQIFFSVCMFSHNASTLSRDFTHSDLAHFCKQDCKYPWLEIYLQWFLFHTSYEDNIKQHDIFCCLLAGFPRCEAGGTRPLFLCLSLSVCVRPISCHHGALPPLTDKADGFN